MYTIYPTDCYVLGKRPLGEANAVLFLATEKFGYISVFAQGVRELKSKLRYHLEPFSVATIDVVRGKEFWRLTNAALAPHLPTPRTSEMRDLCVRLGIVVRRLHHGEENSPVVFDTLKSVCTVEEEAQHRRIPFKLIELTALLRLLDAYGYGSHEAELVQFTKHSLLDAAQKMQQFPTSRVVRHVNQALAASHL